MSEREMLSRGTQPAGERRRTQDVMSGGNATDTPRPISRGLAQGGSGEQESERKARWHGRLTPASTLEALGGDD